VAKTVQLECIGKEGSQVTYAIDYTPEAAGTFDIALRVYASNPNLPHRMDFALVKWA